MRAAPIVHPVLIGVVSAGGFVGRQAVIRDGVPVWEVPNVGVPERLARRMTVAKQQEWLQAFLWGRRVSRRSALGRGAGVLVAPALRGPWPDVPE
jgi:hypothetical protein